MFGISQDNRAPLAVSCAWVVRDRAEIAVGAPGMIGRCIFTGVLCLLAAGCTSSDARMGALRADMASRQAAAELAASRPGGTAQDKERARSYASAQSCIDQLQARAQSVRAANMAAQGAMAAISMAGPGGALAARTMAPVSGMALRGQGEQRVACY
jgi:hypothetical protein